MEDPYAVLGLVKRDKSSDREVFDQYARMALRWHPDKNGGATDRFTAVAHAYAILIRSDLRAKVDAGQRVDLPEYSGAGGYAAAQQLYRQAFGGVGLGSDGRAPDRQAPILRDLALSLEELYVGTTKRLKITRQVLDPKDHARTTSQSQLLEIVIKPGWKAGTKITYERLGDERPGIVPADMIFVLAELPHARFERQGNDLRTRVKIRLKEALLGGELRLKHLDGQPLQVPFKGPVPSGHELVVAGQGMPLPKTPDKKGNLIVVLEVTWPEELSDEARRQLEAVVF